MDTAKWLHWRKRIKLYQIPSLPSVNACFTHMVALREGDGVYYYGDAVTRWYSSISISCVRRPPIYCEAV
jgi:hypothetical protein